MDNVRLDPLKFIVFAQVVSGMDVFTEAYSYGPPPGSRGLAPLTESLAPQHTARKAELPHSPEEAVRRVVQPFTCRVRWSQLFRLLSLPVCMRGGTRRYTVVLKTIQGYRLTEATKLSAPTQYPSTKDPCLGPLAEMFCRGGLVF